MAGMRSFNIEVHEMKAIVMNRPGSTEVLEVVDRPDPVAGPGQALVEVAAAGVNFMDTGVRRGQFWDEMPVARGLGVGGVGRGFGGGKGGNSGQTRQRVAVGYSCGSYSEPISLPGAGVVPVADALRDHT